MRVQTDPRVLLLISLLLTGVWCKYKAVFMYSRLGGDVVLPCIHQTLPDCSIISWTFHKASYIEEVIGGQVRADSDRSSRMSITSNCSLHLHDLQVNDAGSYTCLDHEKSITDVYLSLLTITAHFKLTDLQPGGHLILSCILFTYYDTGMCKPYSSQFRLSWMAEDGSDLPRDSRYELICQTRCNVTLVTKLRSEDNNRKWRCQVNATGNNRAVFQDFTSAFLFQNPPTDQDVIPTAAVVCPLQLPISRIVLCVALPVMVIIVGVFTWRGDRRRSPGGQVTAAAGRI